MRSERERQGKSFNLFLAKGKKSPSNMRCKEYCVENAERERKIRMMKKRKGGRQGEIQYDEALSMNFSF